MAKGIYKCGNVFWIRYAGLDGRVVRESSCSSTFRDAEGLLIQRKQSIKEGKQPEGKRIANHTIGDLAKQYLQWMEGRHRSADTKKYRIIDILTHFGNIPLRRFNTLAVEQYQTELISRGLKPASVNKNISVLKAMFRRAVDWSLVEEDALKRISKVKLLIENNKRLRYLSQEECKNLVNHCQGNTRAIVTMALNTGMRKGEILSLKWEHVDLRHGFILLDSTKNGERREIAINATLRGVLQGTNRRLDIPYVFFDSNTGKPYGDVKRSFNTAVRKAGIRDFHFHDLRHTFASHLVMAGVDITTVKELLGHKTLTMTFRYSHLAPNHKVKALDILDSTINGIPTAKLLHNPMKKELTVNG